LRERAMSDEQRNAAQNESGPTPLTQAERRARAASLFTEDDLEEARRSVAEKRAGVTLKQIWKDLWDHQNSRRVGSEAE
jgi:hypothetical protein